MAEDQTTNLSGKDYIKLVQQQFLFFTFSRQIMFAGYFIVIAVHVSTCYLLIAKGGFLASLSSLVMLINALLGIVFYVWDKNYRKRIELIKVIGSQVENSNYGDHIKGNLLFDSFIILEHAKNNSAGLILMIVTSIGSLAVAVLLWCFISLPYIQKFL